MSEILTLVQDVSVLDNGNALIVGQSAIGATEIEIPGESIPHMIATLHGLLPLLRTVTPQGLETLFQLTNCSVKSSEQPGQTRLVLDCLGGLHLTFSLPIPLLEQMGQRLIEIAGIERDRQSQKPTKPN